MAYLNAQERQALANELINMKFNQAQHRLARMDKQGRLVFYRNTQEVGKWETCYELPGLGVRVTLVEKALSTPASGQRVRRDYDFVEAIVEPLPANKT